MLLLEQHVSVNNLDNENKRCYQFRAIEFSLSRKILPRPRSLLTTYNDTNENTVIRQY